MESIPIGQSSVRARRGGGASGVAVDDGVGHGGLARARSGGSSFYSLSSNNLLFDSSITGSLGSFGPRLPPLPLYSSLPPPFSSTLAYGSPSPAPPSSTLLPPPLLPLPPPITFPSHGQRMTTNSVNTNNGRSRDQRKKQKPSVNPRKEVQQSMATPAEVSMAKDEAKKAPAQKPSNSREEGTALDHLYSLSPPPSSLPLPSFALLRARTATAAATGLCTAAVADDLRRLLCL